MRTGADQLRSWIQRQGFKHQADAADALGIHFTFVSHLLAGRRVPSLGKAVKIERVTGIPAEAWVSRHLGKRVSATGNSDGNSRIYNQSR